MIGFLTVTEAAELLQVGRQSVLNMIYAESISAEKVGVAYVIRKADLSDYIQAKLAKLRAKIEVLEAICLPGI